MATPTYQQYFTETVCKAKNDLCNPRHSFNHGYHDCEHETEKRDMSTHFDPWYAAGYTARLNEIKLEQNANGLSLYHANSDYPYNRFVAGLNASDYTWLAKSVLEAIIRGREYLFPNKKNPRQAFSQTTKQDVLDYFYHSMSAASVEQFAILADVVKQLG